MRHLLGITLVVLSPLVLTAADLKIGDKVFLKPDAEATIDETKVDIKTIPIPATVVEVKGERVSLGKAWVRKSDVMTDVEALEYYVKAIQNEPANPRLWLSRGLVLEHYRQPDNLIINDPRNNPLIYSPTPNAIKDYTEAIRLDPTNTMAYVFRARARGKMLDLESEALDDLNVAIKLDPQNAMAYSIRGWVRADRLLLRGKQDLAEMEAALKDVTEAIRLDPTIAKSYVVRVELLSVVVGNDKSRFDVDTAIKDLGEAIKFDPFNAEAYILRGRVWMEKNEYGNAIKDFTKVISFEPESDEAFRDIALLKATCPDDRVRDGKQAVEYATKACELTNWDHLLNLEAVAAAYAEAGDFTNAIKWQKEVVSHYSSSGATSRKQDSTERLELYRSNKPYRMRRLTPKRPS